MPSSASPSPWYIYLDAGGTFTDCLAYAPSGTIHRVKLLSHGALRGKVIAHPHADSLRVSLPTWSQAAPLAGYELRVLQTGQRTHVLEWDKESQLLKLADVIEAGGNSRLSFELYTGEPAPVVVSRLLTHTAFPAPLPPIVMRLGTTRGTNALLERKGAAVTLITNTGLEDLLLIGDQRRPALFALNVQKRPPLHRQVIGIPARLSADGSEQDTLSHIELTSQVQKIATASPEAVAICLMHSYHNPTHEHAIAESLRAAGLTYVSCSHDLSPQIKIVPRMMTTVVNAYLSPLFDAYLSAMSQANPSGLIQVLTSAGGLQGISSFAPKDSLLSGPAGGAVGAKAIGEACGITRLLTLDMGGTSTDVARIDGSLSYTQDTEVGGIQLMSPAVAIETVAAGGGSICSFDGAKLSVGPESAGAEPGPACYGRGGPLTLTDVNLLLGRLDTDVISIPLDRDAAEQALRPLLRDSGLDRHTCLQGLLQIANETMAAAIRTISQSQGYDPADYALLAFGGAGGLHAGAVARELGINRIILPAEGGILSAVGMRHARLTRFATQQILRKWEEVVSDLSFHVQQVTDEARKALMQEGIGEPQIALPQVFLFLRMEGQEHSLEIPFSQTQHVPKAFAQAYEQLYGHLPPDLPLELVRIEVRLQELAPDISPIEIPSTKEVANPKQGTADYPSYRWESLPIGVRLTGPCLISSQLGTAYIDRGWHLQVDAARNLRLEWQGVEAPYPSATTAQPTAVRLELFARRFQSVAEEMGALLQRTSFSVNVKERLDFSCALMDPDGYLIANAPHIPVHLGSMGVCTRAVLATLPLGSGDVAITNHPGYGGSHLPDITLITAVFDETGQCIGYLANRAHHAEVGGKRPGSMPPDARNLAEEGVVIPPLKLVENGVPKWEAIQSLFLGGPYPSRNYRENLADLRAALASLEAGRQALQALAKQVGSSVVMAEYQQLKDYSAQRLAQQLSPWQNRSWEAVEKLDDGNVIHVKWTLKDRIELDFVGTSPTHPGNLNANLAIVNSAVMYVLRLLIDAPLPLNEGLMQQVDLHVPEGTLLNPVFSADPSACPAVVGGNVETSQRLVDTLIKALGLAACSNGSMNNLLFGDETFGYYETLGGGTGAGPGFDGADGVHQHMTNTRMTDPEVLEHRYPVQVEQLGLRKGSGGMGTFKGGEGLVRRLRFLAPVKLTVLTQHRQVMPYGMRGGEAGKCGEQRIIRSDGTEQLLQGSDQASLEPGDQVEMRTPGGGGWGSST